MKTQMETPMSTFQVSNGSGAVAAEITKGAEMGRLEPDSIDDRVSAIETRPHIPTTGDSLEGEHLVLDENLRPRWKAALIPSGTTDGDMLVWDDALEKWVVFSSSIDLILTWSASLEEWQQVEVPATDGVILQTYTPVSGEPPLKFDILRFTV